MAGTAGLAGTGSAGSWPRWSHGHARRVSGPGGPAKLPGGAQVDGPSEPAPHQGAGHAARVASASRQRSQAARGGPRRPAGLALVVTGRVLSVSDPPSSVRPPATAPAPVPYRVGDRLACPHTKPVLAASDGRSYPLGHPARPPASAGPVACYATVAEATAAGYPEAPLPAGPPGGSAGPCPARDCGPPRCWARRPRRCARGPAVPGSGSCVPSGYVGAYPEVGRRLVVAAARRPAAAAVACPGERPVSQAGSGAGSAACSPARRAPARTMTACCCAGGRRRRAGPERDR